MTRISLILAFACVACSPLAPAPPINSLILDRPYEVNVPAGYSPAKTYPLIVLLHGYGATGFIQDSYFGFAQLADDHGVLVAYPNGTVDNGGKRFWNATDACCDIDASGVDDVAYLNAVLDDVTQNYNVDPKRVFFVGHSNGAFMSHRMACDATARIAAIAVLAGDVWLDPSRCKPTGPMPVLQVHGDADTTIPYGGTSTMPSAMASVGTWADKNGCTGPLTDTGMTLDLESMLPGAETGIAKYTCSVGAAELWTIHGGKHIPSLNLPDWGDNLYAWLMLHPKP